jgi:peroxiredoxin family protein
VEPLRQRGNEVVLFHVLDPQEIAPKFRDPVLLVDMENAAASLEVSPEYARHVYKDKIASHMESLRDKTKSAGMDYFLMDTSRPLDEGLREYLSIRQGRM